MSVQPVTERTDAAQAPSCAESRDADEAALFDWVARTCGGRVVRAAQLSGGNRCRSWAVDVQESGGRLHEVYLRWAPPRPAGVEPYTVRREAQVYRAIAGAGLKAPRLIAEHPRLQAVLTDRAAGIAEFRRLSDAAQKQAITSEFMQAIAALHARDARGVRLDGGASGDRIIDHVRAELAIWRAMADEVGRPDPLIDLAFAWLEANIPDPDEPVVLVHGDAGPGNFLFESGRLTALIDWELAHLGDPMEDLAWFSMRCVMEPVPDFAQSLRDYEFFAGRAIDRARVLYHRVFVSTRVVVIRHRNVTGEPGNAIVSRGLNRRLLVEALAAASGIAVTPPPPVRAPATPRAAMYDRVLDDLRDVVVVRSTDRQVTAAAKNAAKVVKYLKQVDHLGRAAEAAELAALAALLGRVPESVDAGYAALSAALRGGGVPFDRALDFFAGHAAREAQLAAAASGGIAHRHYPPLP